MNKSKNRFFLALVVICLVFSSCSKKTDYKVHVQKYPTLKNKITYMDKTTKWTEELEKSEKTEQASSESTSSSSSQSLFSKMNNAKEKEKESETKKETQTSFSELANANRLFYPEEKKAKLYPNLAGFTNLDTSKLDTKVFDLIAKVVECMNEKTFDTSIVAENYKFLKNVFIYDFKKLEKIESFIVGKPYAVEDTGDLQIPVRLLSENIFYDTIFFISIEGKNEKNYFLEQIYFRGAQNE